MNDSPAFKYASDQLTASSSLTEIEARGTIRIALKQAGLKARDVTSDQMRAVFEKLMPKELTLRGLEGTPVCAQIASGLSHVVDTDAADASPDAVFRHLAGER